MSFPIRPKAAPPPPPPPPKAAPLKAKAAPSAVAQKAAELATTAFEPTRPQASRGMYHNDLTIESSDSGSAEAGRLFSLRDLLRNGVKDLGAKLGGTLKELWDRLGLEARGPDKGGGGSDSSGGQPVMNGDPPAVARAFASPATSVTPAIAAPMKKDVSGGLGDPKGASAEMGNDRIARTDLFEALEPGGTSQELPSTVTVVDGGLEKGKDNAGGLGDSRASGGSKDVDVLSDADFGLLEPKQEDPKKDAGGLRPTGERATYANNPTDGGTIDSSRGPGESGSGKPGRIEGTDQPL
jgi:hypothetical protein